MAPISRPRPPSAFAAAVRICDLSFGEMLWSRRSLSLALLASGGVIVAAVLRTVIAIEPRALPRINGVTIGGPALFGMMMWLLYIRFIIPVLGVFYGTSLIADEVEDKTITYLFTRPIPRSAVLFGKYLAYLACTLLLITPSIVLIYFLIVPLGGGSIGENFPTLLADLGLLAVGLAAYGAVFALVGAVFKRPLVAGLVFAFGWEPGVLLFPGYLRQFTVGYYLQALVPHAMPQDSAVSLVMQMFLELPSIPVSLTMLFGITGLGLWLAGRTVGRREYVLEQ